MTVNNKHLRLQHALTLADLRRGFCAPNPAVGAVIFDKEGNLLGEGYHYAAGEPHAEVHAINQAGSLARNATLYVTLQPCCHHGKTPPCTDLILQSGIRRVIYGYRDLNPAVADKSDQLLADAGIMSEQFEVPAITDFYRSYRHWWQYRRPFVTAKLAISADGKIAAMNSQPLAITGSEANTFTHQHRFKSDAILTTVKTIVNDDPQLNARVNKEVIAKPLYVLDSKLRLPLSAQIFKSAKSITLFYNEPSERIIKLQSKGGRCVPVSCDALGLSWSRIMEVIGQDGVQDLWVEAGGQCLQSLLEAQWLNRFYLYIANKQLGNEGLDAFRRSFSPWLQATDLSWQALGSDQSLVICSSSRQS